MNQELFSQLIQFSWTVITFIFGGQTWIFLQELKVSHKFTKRHLPLLIAFILNTFSAFSLFFLFNLILDESLKQEQNFVAENIKCYRRFYSYSLMLSFVFTMFAIMAWIYNKKNSDLSAFKLNGKL